MEPIWLSRLIWSWSVVRPAFQGMSCATHASSLPGNGTNWGSHTVYLLEAFCFRRSWGRGEARGEFRDKVFGICSKLGSKSLPWRQTPFPLGLVSSLGMQIALFTHSCGLAISSLTCSLHSWRSCNSISNCSPNFNSANALSASKKQKRNSRLFRLDLYWI